MEKYNISTNNIKQIIDYCKQHNYFNAPTVFLIRRKQADIVTIVAVYIDDIDIFSETFTVKGTTYRVTRLSQIDFYKSLLSRDLLFGEILSNALFIKDDLTIASKAQLAVHPIMNYSLDKMKSTAIETQCLFGEQKLDAMDDNFSMLFLDESNLTVFFNRVFFPLSKFIKEYLYETNFMLQTHRYGDRSSLTIELTYFVGKEKKAEILEKLQEELYDKIPEYKLHKMVIPYKKPIGVIDMMPFSVKNVIYEILSKISGDVVVSSTEKPLTDNTSITQLIYYLLVSAVYYFDIKEDFIELNDELYNALLSDSASPLALTLLNNGSISSIKDKIEYEYNLLAKKIYPSLHVNYSEVIRTWDTKIIKDDDMSQYLSKLSNISNSTTWEAIHISQYPQLQINTKALFFIEFYKHILKCFDISSYYKAFIPFTIKYLIDNEI